MTASALYIPQDVINSIVDQLSDDKHALATCALAAHAFCEPCQRHLWSRIDIDNSGEDGNLELENILSDNPRIQFYVRHLRLRLVTQFGTVREVGALPEILQMLPRIRSFSLSHSITNRLLHFGSVPHALKSSIFDLLQYGHLTHVNLSHLQEFPIYYFSRCSQLQELSLWDVNPFHNDSWFEPNPELAPRSKPLPKTQLRSLSLEMESNPSWSFFHSKTYHHIRSSIDLSHLKTISIGHLFVNEEIDECQKILESTRLLEDLTLTLDLSQAPRPPKPLIFNVLPLSNMRSLVVIIHNGPHTATPTPMRWHTLGWLHDTLKIISHTIYIEKFTLMLSDQAVADTEREDDCNLWMGIDRALASNAFPYLRSVTVAFDTQRERPLDMSYFLNKRMPTLVSKRILSFSWNHQLCT